MATQNRMVLDLSHWNDVADWDAIRAVGVVGVIHKFSQGSDYIDPTYAARAPAAKAAQLLWGRYHFGDASNVSTQVIRFLDGWTPDELLALDWEDNSASQMTLDQAIAFVQEVEARTGVIPALYTGNTCKEQLDEPNAALSRCRLWLAQYAARPICPPGWSEPWLWQWTSAGSCAGISGAVDIDGFDGTADDLAAQWSGGAEPAPAPEPSPDVDTVSITLTVPAGTQIIISASDPANIVINPSG